MHVIERSDDPNSARTAALAAELRVVLGRLRRRSRNQADAGDFTPSRLSALSRLERDGPATVTTLARAEGVRPQSMGATIAVLQAAGFVHGAPDPTDGRQTMLSLTARCREWITAHRAARDDWLVRAIQTTLAPDEQELLTRAVALLERLVGA